MTSTKNEIDSYLRIILALAICIILLLIYHFHTVASLKNYTEPKSDSIFNQIILDASQENTASDKALLFPINQQNSQLVWKEHNSREWLSVVAWMKNEDYKNYYEELKNTKTIATIPEGVNLWVTAYPQVKDFCKKLDFGDKSFRIKQYLGLNPNRQYETFVSLWVKPEDLFRPCPDPEINDSECNLQQIKGDSPNVKNIGDYSLFFQELIRSSYSQDGAPWTRLGYTYDWKNNRRNVGASEYILVPNGEYIVEKASSTEQYCR